MNQILKKNYHYLLLFVITIILFSYIIGTNNIVGADTRFYFANIEAYLIKIVSLNRSFKTFVPCSVAENLASVHTVRGVIPSILGRYL